VDVSKRTLIAETPNVLIVHLQRIIFNFDTFQNDKLNQHFDFPQQLDLTPYSYYDVMGKEDRLKKQGSAEKEEEDTAQIDDKKAEGGDEDDQIEPDIEDCFEYKLAGVTVHSGTAHAGHYWAYINTKRGAEGPTDDADDLTWASTEGDRWMEFNDSMVRDFQ
jgi:ubiquitin carboxyl-terminal hydrolase 34